MRGIFWFLLVAFGVWNGVVVAEFRQIKPSEISSGWRCGAPRLTQEWVKSRLQELKQHQPQKYQQLLSLDEQMQVFNANHVEQQKFWAYDFKKDDFYQVTATLRKTGDLTQIWVEDDSWDKGYVTQAEVDSIFYALEIRTPASSINPQLGIVRIDTMLFGQPPNKDGDGIIDFLVLDIRDNYDPQNNKNQFIAGYFSPWDQSNKSTSNRRDLLYLDSYPGIFFQNQHRTETVLATTAHELQHLIHYHYDTDEETWVNEGLSELASLDCGFGLDFPDAYLKDTNQGLTDWSNTLADYARVSLWTLYVAEQLGIRFIHNLTQAPENGITGYQSTLLRMGIHRSFDELFTDWILANLINNYAQYPPYGYQNIEARNLQAGFFQQFNQYPAKAQLDLKRYAGVYFRFRGADTLSLNFSSLPSQAYWVRLQPHQLDIQEIPSHFFQDPQFNASDRFVLVLVNTSLSQRVDFQAYAPFSIDIEEVAYDDGKLDFGLLTDGIAANKFVVKKANFRLTGIKFYVVNSPTSFRIHVYDEGNWGFPGVDLIAPVDTTIHLQRSWFEWDLSQPLEFQKDQAFFIGLEVTGDQEAIAYDHQSNGARFSYLFSGNSWHNLSDFQISDGTRLSGYWMIRAILEDGLVPSGSFTPEDTTLAPLAFSQKNAMVLVPTRDPVLPLSLVVNKAGKVEIRIFNVLGQQVATFHRELPSSGKFNLFWEARSLTGNLLPAGMYFYRAIFHPSDGSPVLRTPFQRILILK